MSEQLPAWGKKLPEPCTLGDVYRELHADVDAYRARMELLKNVLGAVMNSVPFSHEHAGLARRARQALADCERKKDQT